MTPHLYRSGQPERIQNRRSDVEQTGWFRDAVLRNMFGPCRPVKDEGHMKRALINEIAVCALTVFVEALAVIGGEHDQRFAQKATAFEVRQKISEHPIDVSQLRFITRLTAAQARVRREIVGCVQIVEMEEQEERGVCILIEPADSRSRHLSARPLQITHVRDGLVMKIERAVVNIEIAAQSETPVRYETAHERCGMVAGILQNGCKRLSRQQTAPRCPRLHLRKGTWK